MSADANAAHLAELDAERLAAEVAARVQEPAAGARYQCCALFGYVVRCEDQIDLWSCPVCGSAWTYPCRPR